jgi:hypothetical protein
MHLVKEAEEAGAKDDKEVSDYIVKQLKSGDLQLLNFTIVFIVDKIDSSIKCLDCSVRVM